MLLPCTSTSLRFCTDGVTLSNAFLNRGPSFHTPVWPFASSARTRQKYSLLLSATVGDAEVPIVVPLQHQIEPVGKPSAELTWTS